MCLFLAISRSSISSSEKTYIDDADYPALIVHYRKREEFIEHEKFHASRTVAVAGIGDHAPDHDSSRTRSRGAVSSRRCWQELHETFLGIDREEIDHAFAHAVAPDPIGALRDTHVRIEQRKIFRAWSTISESKSGLPIASFIRLLVAQRYARGAANQLSATFLRDAQCLCCATFRKPRLK